ncbi:MAG: A/G-specific adenine glycosylase [Spirochaetes bacterium]|nr:MAG: A/G-specific adenine glycosylase [Spirochaetota bacterium]
MLQQTQVSRVVPKFLAWMNRFPCVEALASASQTEVLALWSGLGYNRRALALKATATAILKDHGGSLPREEAVLRTLPGVGVYTSRAVFAFAFDIPTVFLETNIRTVYIKHFFEGMGKVADSLLYPIAATCLDRSSPARWHNALMDYGAYLKKSEANHGAKATAYRKQSEFRTSFRRVRGEVLKVVLKKGQCDVAMLYETLPFSREEVERSAEALAAEGFLRYGEGILEVLEP